MSEPKHRERVYRALLAQCVRSRGLYPPITLALALTLAFGLICESAWLVYRAPTDVPRYQCYALAFWRGGQGLAALSATQCAFLHLPLLAPAFRTLPLEYPPLSLLVFSLPLLAPVPYYSLAFAIMMTLVAILIAWLLDRYHSRMAMGRYLVLLVLGGGALFQLRYDLFPSVGMLLCLIAAERRRWTAAYLALAIATLLKIFPLVALPALIIAERRDRALHDGNAVEPDMRLNAALYGGPFGALVVAVSGLFAFLGGPNAALGPLRYVLARPPEIESVQSSVAWAARVAGAPLAVVYSYGSINGIGPLDRQIGWAEVGLFIAGSVYAVWLQWRGRTSLGQTMVALLCVLIVTGKVLSPQYLLWVIPLIAYVGASRGWLLTWAVMSLISTGAYIVYFGHLSDAATAAQVLQTLPGFFEVIAVRNAMLLLLTLGYLLNRRQVWKARAPHQGAGGAPSS